MSMHDCHDIFPRCINCQMQSGFNAQLQFRCKRFSIGCDNSYIFDEETEDGLIYCGWQNYYDPDTRLCDFDLTVFTENEDGSYRREDESHTERCYTLDELTAALTAAGFELIAVHGDIDGSAPTGESERWYLIARAKKD